jgi:glycerophosphoryl diester phosphodiesterase
MGIKHAILILLVIMIAIPGFAQSGTAKHKLVDFRDSQSIESQKPILIAHRGGVVTADTPECSLAAIRLAKEQGFAMVELDVRKSLDGVPIIFHDRDLKKSCGIDNSIANMESKQITKIKFAQSDRTICTLDLALDECRLLSLGVMLDVKVRDDKQFYKTIANLIKKHKYDASTITISGDQALRQCFKGVVMLTITGDEFKQVQQGKHIDLRGKYWFGLPDKIPCDMVKRLHQNGAYVIPAINTFRYPKENHYELARRDINRLIKVGVEGFQIDSVYRPLFDKE